MDRIDVTVHFDSQGGITPLDFIWKDDTFKVESIGRSWKSPTSFHVLVMVHQDRTYELIFDLKALNWSLVDHKVLSQSKMI